MVDWTEEVGSLVAGVKIVFSLEAFTRSQRSKETIARIRVMKSYLAPQVHERKPVFIVSCRLI